MSGRKVFLSSDMSVDERLLLVSQGQSMASLVWPWLLTALDDWGRCEAAPLRQETQRVERRAALQAAGLSLAAGAAHGGRLEPPPC
jgi:hypothetical protein